MTKRSSTPTGRAPLSRGRLCLRIGALSFIVALLAALGPAREGSAQYEWPPPVLPADTPTADWSSPLLLASRQPKSLEIEIPCDLRPLSAAERNPTVLATTRRRGALPTLTVRQTRGWLVAQVGETRVARIQWPPAQSTHCPSRLAFTDGVWTLRAADGTRLGGGPSHPFVVTGLFSQFDLRGASVPRVVVTASLPGTSPSLHQLLLWPLALALAMAALVLAIRSPEVRARPAMPRMRARIGALRLGSTDLVVTAVLLVWWIVAPAHTDDGWVLTRERGYSDLGAFPTYFDNAGVSQPLGYWYEWLHRWLADATTAVPILRLPALLLALATWACCRWLVAKLIPDDSGRHSAVRWSALVVFLLSVVAWGMDFRPEPIIALLAGIAFVSMVSFCERPRFGPLALCGGCIALGVSAHPEGLVTAAPLAASVGYVVAWVRQNRRQTLETLIGVATAVAALLVLVAFIDSDVAHRSRDLRFLRSVTVIADRDWRDELLRYDLLSGEWIGNPVRRLSVALMLVALLSFLVRRRLDGRAEIAGWTLLASFVSLLITPSKLPWHFGSLAVAATVAVSAEVGVLVRDRRSGWSVRPFAVMVVTAVAAAWAWSFRAHWDLDDLRTLTWPANLGEVASPLRALDLGSPAAWLVLFAVAGVVIVGLSRLVHKDLALASVPWRLATWSIPIVVVPVLVGAIGTFARDAHATDGWTLTRQSLRSLRGDAGCGLADDVVVPDTNTLAPLPRAARSGATPGRRVGIRPWAPSVETWGPVVDGATPRQLTTPWYRLPAHGDFGVFVAGHTSGLRSVRVDWGTVRGGRARSQSSAPIDAQWNGAVADRRYAWRLLAAGDLPRRPPAVDLVRFVLRSNFDQRRWAVAVSGPVTYRHRTLTEMTGGSRPTLVHPAVGLYFPCARQPMMAGGVVEVPHVLLLHSQGFWPLNDPTSPFAAVDDLDRTLEVSTADSPIPLKDISVYVVDSGPRAGEAVARASPIADRVPT